MFEEIIRNQGTTPDPNSFSIEKEIRKAKHEATNCHEAVVHAEAELLSVKGLDLRNFNRNSLKDVWASNCSFGTKYLATLWWGHVFRQIFNNVYSQENLNKIQRISSPLNSALTDAAQTKDYQEFCKKLSAIVASMQGGSYRIPYVGPAFFTKIIQFFFAAHPVQSRKDYLPIIADRWLLRALYCEMTDCGNTSVRDDVLVLDHTNVFLRKERNGCIAESYVKCIDYFNERCKAIGVHPWNMEGLLFKNDTVRRHFLELLDIPRSYEPEDRRVVLRVYGVPGNNYGKTFQILNNQITLPHNTDEVFVEYEGRLYEARLGSYCGRGNTLRGKDSIKTLIEDNHWLPNQEFEATFLCTDEGRHIYRIQH